MNPTVIDPHVRVDGVPDWRSVDDLLASILHPGMGDEARVLAVFHTVRRLQVHGPTPREVAYDFHRVMHTVGTGACLSMTTPLHMLYERLGYRSQSWVHDGHHMMQVEYGGAWHCLDPHMCFSCYDRGRPPVLAAIEQLRADPSLARDAVAEGRAGAGYLLCGDSPDWFAGDEGDWYLEAGGDWPELTVEEPFGGIALRPGERYVRTWHPGEHWWRAGWLQRDGCGPIHHCAEADRADAASWPLYEPHAWTRPETGRTYYRAWGVGRLEYEPRFADGSWRAGLAAEAHDAGPDAGPDAVDPVPRPVPRRRHTGDDRRADAAPLAARNAVVEGDVLTTADPDRPARVVFDVDCPYVLTALDLGLKVAGAARAWVRVRDRSTVASLRDGAAALLAHDWTEVPLAAVDGGRAGGLVDGIDGCFEGYRLCLQLAGGARLAAMRLVSHFQLNRFSLPHLRAGRNRVRVATAAGSAPVTVRYDWEEGPDWAVTRTFETPARDGDTFDIDVEGPRWPRMRALTLSA